MALSVNGSGASFDLTRARKRKHITEMQDESHDVALSEEEVARDLFQNYLGVSLQYLLLRLSASDNDATHLQVVLEVFRDAKQNEQTEIEDVDAVVDAKLRDKYSTVNALQQNFHDASTQTNKAKNIIKNVQGRFCSSVYRLRTNIQPAFDRYLAKLTDVQKAVFFDNLFLQLWQQRVLLVNQNNIVSITNCLTTLTREIKPSTSAVSLSKNEQEVERKRYETFKIPISQRDKMLHLQRNARDKYDTVMAQMNKFVQEDSQGKTSNEIIEKFLAVYEQEYPSPQKEEERARAELMNPETRKVRFHAKNASDLNAFVAENFKARGKNPKFTPDFQRGVQERMEAYSALHQYVQGFMSTMREEAEQQIKRIQHEGNRNEMLHLLAQTFDEHAEESSVVSAPVTARAARLQDFNNKRDDAEQKRNLKDLLVLEDAVQKLKTFTTLVADADHEWTNIQRLFAQAAEAAAATDKATNVSALLDERPSQQKTDEGGEEMASEEQDSDDGADFD